MYVHRGAVAHLDQPYRAGGVLVLRIFGRREPGTAEGESGRSIHVIVVVVVAVVAVVAVVVTVIVATIVPVVVISAVVGAGGVFGAGRIFAVGEPVSILVTLAVTILDLGGADAEGAAAGLGNEGGGVQGDGVAHRLPRAAAAIGVEDVDRAAVTGAIGSPDFNIDPGDDSRTLGIEGHWTFKGEHDGAHRAAQSFTIVVAAGRDA